MRVGGVLDTSLNTEELHKTKCRKSHFKKIVQIPNKSSSYKDDNHCCKVFKEYYYFSKMNAFGLSAQYVKGGCMKIAQHSLKPALIINVTNVLEFLENASKREGCKKESILIDNTDFYWI
jgi:hypothetical protein